MSGPTEPSLFDVQVPTYWDGLLGPVTDPAQILPVLGAMLTPLAHAEAPLDELPACVRTRVSFDGPRPDRVWVVAEQHAQTPSSVDVVRAASLLDSDPLRCGLAPWVESLRPQIAGSFDVDIDETGRRLLPHYHGFLHAWTDQHHARRYFRTWPAGRQAEFLHEYLLYATNDREGSARHGWTTDDARQTAAAWLLEQRRFLMRWTVVLREEPQPRPDPNAVLAGELSQAVQDLFDALSGDPLEQATRRRLEEALSVATGPSPKGVFDEVLARAELDPGLRATRVACITLRFAVDWDPPHPRLQQQWDRLQQAQSRAQRWVW